MIAVSRDLGDSTGGTRVRVGWGAVLIRGCDTLVTLEAGSFIKLSKADRSLSSFHLNYILVRSTVYGARQDAFPNKQVTLIEDLSILILLMEAKCNHLSSAKRQSVCDIHTNIR